MKFSHIAFVALILASVPVSGWACSSHPAEVSHSDWAWMQQQRDPKTNKVETNSADFFSNRPKAPSPDAASGGEERPIRYVK